MFKIIDGGFEPVRATKYSAYVDLFAREDITIGAGETKIVKLGVKIDLDKLKSNKYKTADDKIDKDSILWQEFLKSHYLEVALRSSLGVKGLIIANGIGIIDLDYPDEIGLIVHNPISKQVSREEAIKQLIQYNSGDISKYQWSVGFKISKGDKVAQCTLKEHKGYLMGYESDVIREGGFGSTGK